MAIICSVAINTYILEKHDGKVLKYKYHTYRSTVIN